jgi:hypothetical protein
MMKKALMGIAGFAAAAGIGLLLSPAAGSSNLFGSSTPVTVAADAPGGRTSGPADGVSGTERQPASAAAQFALGKARVGQRLGASSVSTSTLDDGTVCVQVAVADGSQVTSCGGRAAFERGDIVVAYQAIEGGPTVLAGAAPAGLRAVEVAGRAAELGDGSWAVEAAGKPSEVTTTVGATRETHSIRR